VDDHPLVREWLTNLINQQSDLKVCGEAGSASEGLKLIATTKPNLAIVDISMEGGSGIELIKNIKAVYPDLAVIVLSMYDESHHAERALRAGAKGYVMKREATKKIIEAIRRILEGKFYLSDAIAQAVTTQFVKGKTLATSSRVEQLSDRELEVFDLLGQGLGTRQIAESLRVGMKTVQSYCARIKDKLNLSSATELMREAIRHYESQNPK